MVKLEFGKESSGRPQEFFVLEKLYFGRIKKKAEPFLTIKD